MPNSYIVIIYHMTRHLPVLNGCIWILGETKAFVLHGILLCIEIPDPIKIAILVLVLLLKTIFTGEADFVTWLEYTGQCQNPKSLQNITQLCHARIEDSNEANFGAQLWSSALNTTNIVSYQFIHLLSKWWLNLLCNRYFRHASGEMYVISRALAKFISINRSDQLFAALILLATLYA